MSEDRLDQAEPPRIGPTLDDPTLVHWARFRERFAEALKDDDLWTLEELEQRIALRRAFFFPGKDAAIVGQIEVYPTGARIMQFLWAVGDRAEIVAMEPGLVVISRMMGCSRILIEDTPETAHMMTPLGYGIASVTVSKEV